MKEARDTLKKAIQTIEEMNEKYYEAYGSDFIKPFWNYYYGIDKIEIYTQALEKSGIYTMESAVVKNALQDIENRKHWEYALANGRA